MTARYLESEDSRDFAWIVRQGLENYRRAYGVAAVFGDVDPIDDGQDTPLYNVTIYVPVDCPSGLSKYMEGFLAASIIWTQYILNFRDLQV